MNWRSKGAAVASHSYAPVPDGPRLLPRQRGAIDLNAAFHAELRAKRERKAEPRFRPWNHGWGEDWTDCPECFGCDDNCSECGGEGGWPASATRYDDGDE